MRPESPDREEEEERQRQRDHDDDKPVNKKAELYAVRLPPPPFADDASACSREPSFARCASRALCRPSL